MIILIIILRLGIVKAKKYNTADNKESSLSNREDFGIQISFLFITYFIQGGYYLQHPYSTKENYNRMWKSFHLTYTYLLLANQIQKFLSL